LVSTGTHTRVTMESLGHAIQRLTKKYKTVLCKEEEHLQSVEVTDMLFFQSLEKTTFCYTKDGRRNGLDVTLDDLHEILDPDEFS